MLGLFKTKKKTANATILEVDDEADLRSTLETRLKWNKFKVITASNGQEGLDLAASERPDLILLDNNMPIMTGIEMLARLREDEQLKVIPVIMVTAACEPQKIAAASSFDVVDYVTKPFDFADLMEKIFQMLDKK
ncbi:MAG: response regulator [Phycisphaerae bacterium]|nr:response regulator [Phycisphaerae bacterium]